MTGSSRWAPRSVALHDDVPTLPETNADDSELLDLEMIGELRSLARQDTTGRIAGLVEEFLAAAAARVDDIRAAACGDLATLQTIAHSLKGSSANFGTRRVAAVCDRLQHPLDDAALVAAVDELVTELTASGPALRVAFAPPAAPAQDPARTTTSSP